MQKSESHPKLSGTAGSECYSGIDNLEVMQEAHNYNHYLRDIVVAGSRGAIGALDFGAGIGTFAVELHNLGIQVTCIEPDPCLRARLQNKHLEAHESLDAIPPDSMGYIYSLNVLEHIENDLGTLAEIYRRLKPGGKLLIYVPAFQMLFSSVDKKVGHKRRYTREGLVELLRLVGFQVDEAMYVDSLGFLVALLFKAIGDKKGDLNPTAVRIFDRCVFPLSVILDHVANRVAGKNLLVRAHRPLK